MSSMLPTLITAAVGILAALLTYWGTRGKTRVDRDTTSTGQLIEGWAEQAKSFRADLDRALGRIDALEAENVEAKAQRDDANRQARLFEEHLRDALELVTAYAEYVGVLMAHIMAGSPPPPPKPSWRIERHQNQTNRED